MFANSMEIRGHSIKPDSRPLYDRASEALNWFIEQSGFKPGDRLPGESELARQLGISRPTLREAMGALESQGVISRRHGVGAFVTAPVRGALSGGLEKLESLYTLASKAGINAERVDWEIELISAGEETAQGLEIELGSPLIRAQATIADQLPPGNGDDQPDYHYFTYLDSYVKPEYVEIDELKAFTEGTLLDFLLQKNQARLSYTNTRLYATASNAPVSHHLHIAQNHPLLLLVEIFFSDSGIPIVWTRNYFVTEKVSFQIIRRIITLK